MCCVGSRRGVSSKQVRPVQMSRIASSLTPYSRVRHAACAAWLAAARRGEAGQAPRQAQSSRGQRDGAGRRSHRRLLRHRACMRRSGVAITLRPIALRRRCGRATLRLARARSPARSPRRLLRLRLSFGCGEYQEWEFRYVAGDNTNLTSLLL